MDHLTPQQRHANMAAIRSKDTKPEMIVRRGLWKRGFRYRLNHKRLPGHPDLVLRKYRTCIFVNGCFWHGHLVRFSPNESVECRVESLESVESGEFKVESSACCKIDLENQRRAPASQTNSISSDDTCSIHDSACCKIPKTNREFWVDKIRRNQERDQEEQKKLAAMGWHCITVWECELTEQRVQRHARMNSAESRGKSTEGQLWTTKQEETLESIAFTLNHIWLQDHQAKVVQYPSMDEEDMQMPMAAEESLVQD